MKSKFDKRKEAIARMNGNIDEWKSWAKDEKTSVDADRYREMISDYIVNGTGKTAQDFAQSKINALKKTIKNTEAKL